MDEEAQPDETSEPLGYVQGHIPEVEHLFDEATVKAIIKKANNPQSAAGPSRLRYSHLQAPLCDGLVEEIAEFATLVFSSRSLPKYFGHCIQALIFPGSRKRRYRSRSATFSEGLLAPLSAVDKTINSQTISSPGDSTVL